MAGIECDEEGSIITIYGNHPHMAGIECDEEGSTTKSLIVLPQYWRVSPSSQDIRLCPDANLGIASSCVGTLDEDGVQKEPGNLCKEGTTGPYCQVCSEPEHYMVDSECIDCKNRLKDASMAVPTTYLVIGGLLVLLYIGWLKVRAYTQIHM